MKSDRKLTITLEWIDGGFSGQIKDPGFFFTTEGESVREVTENITELVRDYVEHEGSKRADWKTFDINAIQFECIYKLGAFFEHFKEIKISALAARAGINTNLVQQYVSGNKKASEVQAKKLERAVHELANELRHISLA